MLTSEANQKNVTCIVSNNLAGTLDFKFFLGVSSTLIVEKTMRVFIPCHSFNL